MAEPRALLFAQYLRTLGGGERVMVSIADALQDRFDVTVMAPGLPDWTRWETFGLPMHLDIVQGDARRFTRASIGADLVVSMTNHVPLPSFAKRSLLIVQFPYDDVVAQPLLRRAWSRWVVGRYELVVYSGFVAEQVTARWSASATILPPAVEQRRGSDRDKQPLILSVGRLVAGSHSKRHDVLLDVFERMSDAGWRLVIAGGGDPEDAGVRRLVDRATAIGASVVVDASHAQLDDLYRSASIYWHAAGFGRSPLEPERAEHFGMTTVEAMSAGAVPIVYRDGGQRDLVDETVGATWTTLDELEHATRALISDPTMRTDRARRARERACRYRPSEFRRGFFQLLDAPGPVDRGT